MFINFGKNYSYCIALYILIIFNFKILYYMFINLHMH